MPRLMVLWTAYPVAKEVDYFKTENYTRILSNIDPLVEQVRKEIPNHLCSFGNIKQILDILLIVDIISSTIQRE